MAAATEPAALDGRGARRMRCHIRIKGQLDSSWQEWFERLKMVHEAEGTSKLFGSRRDQTASSWLPPLKAKGVR